MATITAAAAGGNWSATGTWVGGVVPTAADDVLFTATSGNVTLDASSTCLTLDCTGYTHTLTHNAAVTLTIAGTKLLFVSGMTYTLGNATTSAIIFSKTTAGTVAITSGGKTFGNVTTSSATSSSATYQLQDNSTIGAAGTWTHTAGTLDTNNKTCSWGFFSSNNSNVRTVTFGSSAITLAGGAAAFNVQSTSFTMTTNTAVVTLNGATAQFSTTTTQDMKGLSVVLSGSGVASTSGCVLANFTRTGTAVKTDKLTLNSGPLTITGTLTLGGNSTRGVNRLLIQSSAIGTQRTVNCTGAAVVINGDVDFSDFALTGSPSWTNAGNAWIGDALGNSGITFTTSAQQTWSGNTTGNWSTAANWTSRVPLPQDDVVINGLTSNTITLDMPRTCANFNLTGSTGGNIGASQQLGAFGNITWVSGVGWTGGSNAFTLFGRGTHTITSAGKTFGAMTTQNFGGTYTLQDAFNCTGVINLQYGTLNTNNFAVSCSTVTLTNTNATRIITLGSSVLTITGTGTIWNGNTTGVTWTANTGTIVISDTSATSKTFSGAGVDLNGASISITGGGTGAVIFSGANTSNAFTVNAPKTLTLPAGVTTTVGTYTGVGTATNAITLNSSTSGTQATLKQTSGIAQADYMSYRDIAATGGATFYAGANSTSVSNNTGWTASGPVWTTTILLSHATHITETATKATSGTVGLSTQGHFALVLTKATSRSGGFSSGAALALLSAKGASRLVTISQSMHMLLTGFKTGLVAAVVSAAPQSAGTGQHAAFRAIGLSAVPQVFETSHKAALGFGSLSSTAVAYLLSGKQHTGSGFVSNAIGSIGGGRKDSLVVVALSAAPHILSISGRAAKADLVLSIAPGAFLTSHKNAQGLVVVSSASEAYMFLILVVRAVAATPATKFIVVRATGPQYTAVTPLEQLTAVAAAPTKLAATVEPRAKPPAAVVVS